jgi:hypothetical protein
VDPNFGIATGSYVDERDDWPAAIARAAREGWPYLELTAVGGSRLDLLEAIDTTSLEPFARVSLHTPSHGYTADELLEQIRALPFTCDLVLHPDVWRDEPLIALRQRAVFENMDLNKEYGRSVDDMAEVFARFPQAGFCLDVAHVWTNDPSLALGHDLLDAFGDRLRQLHVSGIEPDGTHRDTTEADLELYAPLLGRCRSVPWILEGVPV